MEVFERKWTTIPKRCHCDPGIPSKQESNLGTVILIWLACGLSFVCGWTAHARVIKRRLSSYIAPPEVSVVDLTDREDEVASLIRSYR